MSDPVHLELLGQGREAWNAWRAAHPGIAPFLRSARLEGRDLAGYDLHDAYLRRAHLDGARLDGCRLREANLSGASLQRASLVEAEMAGVNLRAARLRGANLRAADLKSAILVDTDLRDADLSRAQVYGISAWEVRLDGARQSELVVTRPDQPRITVDDLEVAQFIYVLLNHRKLRDVFDTTTERGVLILGRFQDGGLDTLRAVASSLRGMGYVPILFDFDRPRQRTYTETVLTLAGLSSFAVADLSGPSVGKELEAIVKAVMLPVVPIIERSRSAASMTKDLAMHDHFLYPPVEFESTEDLVAQIPARVIAPARAFLERHGQKLRALL
ncbi:MAG: pentapeptide repeat-containing protein [Burkholderiales bacterium]|nr:pentapeptide repeat-containing protein [Burkholderiales bacterium]